MYGAAFGGRETLLSLDEYLEIARTLQVKSSPAQRREQIVSFAAGNLGIEDASVTAEFVASLMPHSR